MKYVMLIFQGTTPTPESQEWASLPEDEQKQVYADYQALNSTPGVTAGLPMGRPQKERYRDMRKYVLMILALGALIAVSAVGIATAAGGETPVTVKVGELELTANGGFSPTALSKTKQTPIELKASGEVKMANGEHPPAVR